MIRPQRSITINSCIETNELLAIIGRFTREFEKPCNSCRGIDIDFSIQSRRRGPFVIPKEITKALTKLFQTIANTRSRILSFTTCESMEICGSSGKHDDKLFLEIGPNICDDDNFRAMIGTAIKTMALTHLKIHGYGNIHPIGTIGNASTEELKKNRQREPSLWDHVESSDSIENLHVSIQGPEVSIQGPGDGSDVNNGFPDKAQCLPRLWEAIKRNKSLSSLAVHLYCRLPEQVENEERLTMLQRRDTLSTMKSLSTSLKGHSSIRKLALRYRRDAHQRTLLVPHAMDILESATLHEFKLERFFLYVTDEQFGFPMHEFTDALSKRRFGDSKENLKVLALSNIGLTDVQANELLQNLPNSVKVLDLSKNKLEDFPVATNNHNSSQLAELNLWKNPCLYNRDQENSLGLLISLLKNYPCLKDFGPWDKWQFQTQLCYPHLEHTIGPSLRNLVARVDVIADQNRCKTRFLQRNSLLAKNPSLWPIILSETMQSLAPARREQRRKLLEASFKPLQERQANVLFSVLRENVSGGIFTLI